MREQVSFRIDVGKFAQNDPYQKKTQETDNGPDFPFTTYRYMVRQLHEETAEQVLSKVGRGTWIHATLHLTTAILSPAAYAPLPKAMASLGWPAGFAILAIGTAVAVYCSVVLASLWEWDGVKHVCYRDLAGSIFGKSGYRTAACFQEIAALGKTVIICIAAGRSLQAISRASSADRTMFTLQEFISLFGLVQLGLSQVPDFHSLRWLNAVCTISTIGFAAMAVGMLVHNGKDIDHTVVEHHLHDKNLYELFATFIALGTMSFSLGDAVLPEIQATVQEPSKQNMFKAISTTYALTIITLWTVAFAGSMKLGSTVSAYSVAPLAGPTWQIVLLHSLGLIQMSGCFQIYCRPTYSFFEGKLMAVEGGPFTLQKCLTRFFATSFYIALTVLVAAAMPFYGSWVSLVGAMGFTPIDFVFPLVAGIRVCKGRENCSRFKWGLHVIVALVYSLIAVVGTICAVKLVALDARRHRFFNNY